MRRALALAAAMSFAACGGARASVADPRPLAPTTAEERDARAFVEALHRGAWEDAFGRFDGAMSKLMPPSRLKSFWESLEDVAGSYVVVAASHVEKRADGTIVDLKVQFARETKRIRVVVDASERVVGLFGGPDPDVMEAKTRGFVAALAKGDSAAATTFLADAAKEVPPKDGGVAAFRGIEEQLGAFVSIEKLKLKFDGSAWISAGDATFANGKVTLRVAYDGHERVVAFDVAPLASDEPWQPPAYADKAKFVEERVRVGRDVPLPGTLTLPRGDGPFPIAILVHGSGPNHQDETNGPQKPFKDIAWGLASRGIAVLRYDKRTSVVHEGVQTVKEEVIDGARAAIDLAVAHAKIDPKRVIVVGHSQGGYLAPRIAREDGRVAAIVSLAGPTRSFEELNEYQARYFYELSPTERTKRGVDEATALRKRIEDPKLDPAAVLPNTGGSTGRYFLDLRGYEPAKVAASLGRPVLVLQGERDYQVTLVDFDGWKRELAKTPHARFVTYPALNHHFVAGSGKPSPAEYDAAGHVDAAVIDDLASFVLAPP